MQPTPKVSFAIPVLNSAKTLGQCLAAITGQDYPAEQMEIVVADGGSTDDSAAIARQYGAKVVPNPRKTGEAGKAEAIRHCTGEIVALVDSDNILPDVGWLAAMVAPFYDSVIVASEPWEYTWRRSDPAWTRYCALVGVNDPLCLYLGNYDRLNHARNDWTRMRVGVEDRGTYLKLTLDSSQMPTIGANGFMVRRDVLGKLDGYFFDIDIPGQLVAQGHRHMAKVKTGIIHLYAEQTRDFVRKQRRRVMDYLFFRSTGQRTYRWDGFRAGQIRFVMATLLIVPVWAHAVKGFFKKPDWAWALHPWACWLTLWIYGTTVLKKQLGWKPRELNRGGWNLL